MVARCSVFSVIFGFLCGSVFGYEHVLDPMFHALGFAEKPLEVLAPEGINNILIASVVAGVSSFPPSSRASFPICASTSLQRPSFP